MKTVDLETLAANAGQKSAIMRALATFIAQRPGLEPANYGTRASYVSEMRSITRDRNDAEELWRYVDRSSITADELRTAFSQAFMGRLSWDDERQTLDYYTGQYFPTEYRKAVCAVLASACWYWFRDNTPQPALPVNLGDKIREAFHRNFSRGVAKRWGR